MAELKLKAIEAERKRVGDSGEWCRLSAEEVDALTRRIREQDATIAELRALVVKIDDCVYVDDDGRYVAAKLDDDLVAEIGAVAASKGGES